MTLADLTDRQAVLDAVAECDHLGRDAFLDKYGFGRAYNYFLVIDGRRYDSKAIVGVAYGYQFPELGPLRATDFSGGLATVKKKLDDLGFQVLVLDEGDVSGDYWWAGRGGERYWVEIRRIPEGLGVELRCPLRDKDGEHNPWYDLIDDVRVGDTVYHWNAEQGRFVGRSFVASKRHLDADSGERVVVFSRFVALSVDLSLNYLRSITSQLEVARDALQQTHQGATLYLPFQFRSDGLRLMSNYFAKLPASMQQLVFGSDGLAEEGLPEPPSEEGPAVRADERGRPGGFLRPFTPRADADYIATVAGGSFKRGRTHETLVNDFAQWLRAHGLKVASNAAIDLGLEEPAIIIEAKVVKSGRWAHAIREAVGQLYEYRFFQVVPPDAALLLLASEAVPKRWLEYLERDRRIGAAWRTDAGFRLSARGAAALRLSGLVDKDGRAKSLSSPRGEA